MIYNIPLNPSASQEIRCTLSTLPCRIWVRQLATGLYLDLWLKGNPIILGALLVTNVDIIRNPSSPLPGKLYIVDLQGTEDPYFDGLGTRFFLRYETDII